MTSSILTIKQSFQLDINKVFDFFAKPENLKLITPGNLFFEILTPSPIDMREGALIEYRINILSIPVRWRTIISKFDAPNIFIDEQLLGPYSKWHHTHCFSFKDGCTTVEDTVEYLPPANILGVIANRFYIKKTLREIFEYRFHETAKIFKKKYPNVFIEDKNPMVIIK